MALPADALAHNHVQAVEEGVPWAREAVTLLHGALARFKIESDSEAALPSDLPALDDDSPAAQMSRRLFGRRLVIGLLSWLEDAAEAVAMARTMAAHKLREGTRGEVYPPALRKLLKALVEGLGKMRLQYAQLTRQTMGEAVGGVLGSGAARGAALQQVKQQGLLREAALWSYPVAARALRSCSIALGMPPPEALCDPHGSIPPGHTVESWTSPLVDGKERAFHVPPGHTRESWFGTESDVLAHLLSEEVLRHRALSQTDSFKECLQLEVKGQEGRYSVSNFAFGLSSVPAVLSVLSHPRVVERMTGDGCAWVLGASTGVIPLILSSALSTPCTGVEILPFFSSMAEETLQTASKSLAGSTWLDRRRKAIADSRVVCGDAAEVEIDKRCRLVWITSLCWDEELRTRVYSSIVRTLAEGALIVDYSHPPKAVRGVRVIARVGLAPGSVTWAPAASGVRQVMYLSVCE
jgi:hypothetical protein